MIKPILIEDISTWNEQDLLDAFSNKPNFAYLDSADPNSRWSEYTIMGFSPFLTIKASPKITTIIQDKHKILSHENPFDILDTYLKEYTSDLHLQETPFWGGAIGYISYEAMQLLPDFPKYPPPRSLPLLHMSFYNKIISINKKTSQKYYIYSGQNNSEPYFHFKDLIQKQPQDSHKLSISNIQANISKKNYIKTVNKIKKHIKEGDIYQANFSYRFKAKFNGSTINLYNNLTKQSPAPFSAFIKAGPITICSSSPERFIKITGKNIVTRPIKGTIARGKSITEDTLNQIKLINSPKDNAELLMIIDLERNDLGKICDFNTIHVPELVTIEQFAQVFHLVATIKGKLKKSISHIQALKQLFPGGSITGVPKIRATEIISQMETAPRGIYTGCIGYIGFNNNSDLNIAIRTIYAIKDQLFFHTGSGIVADSDPESEWEETQLKAKGFLKSIEKDVQDD